MRCFKQIDSPYIFYVGGADYVGDLTYKDYIGYFDGVIDFNWLWLTTSGGHLGLVNCEELI